ncbi:serine/threonine protein phosphatase [Serinibacter arcticus]|uniref:Serine/threonine protein phosphatase n=2 Tax=Serinibacter arcticus TaxID=1655435 RepID=A0A2U2A088_9MICO|nr:serine/threonine protein phosphatase [Serinibacter arcticus]
MEPFSPLLPPEDADDALLAPAVLITDFEPDVGADVSATLAAAAPAYTAAPPEAPTAPIGVERPCARCGGTIARDGYCELCGEPAASERDHYRESPAAWVGGACDRGVVHSKNEDAMALGVLEPDGDVAVLVVCDGVSTAPDSDVASLAAARAAATVVLDGIRNADAPSAEQIRDLSALLGRAAIAGNEAVVETTGEDKAGADNPPSCTFVAAAIDGPLVVTAWLGDSRAYWLPDDGVARQLSVDHSWAQEAIEQGMPRIEAERARHAHAITRWLGTDAPDLAVRTDAMVASTPGWVMVCSDGLWNYCSPAADLAALVHRTAEAVGSEPTTLAAELVTWANAQGGRDNITVALARLEPEQV